MSKSREEQERMGVILFIANLVQNGIGFSWRPPSRIIVNPSDRDIAQELKDRLAIENGEYD